MGVLMALMALLGVGLVGLGWTEYRNRKGKRS